MPIPRKSAIQKIRQYHFTLFKKNPRCRLKVMAESVVKLEKAQGFACEPDLTWRATGTMTNISDMVVYIYIYI